MSALVCVRPAAAKPFAKTGPRLIMKKPLTTKILFLIALLIFVSCKKVHQQLPQPHTGRMLQVELKMPEPWKKIVIGHSVSSQSENENTLAKHIRKFLDLE